MVLPGEHADVRHHTEQRQRRVESDDVPGRKFASAVLDVQLRLQRPCRADRQCRRSRLPLFYGRNIYTAIEGRATPAGPGPYYAY
ncbi:DUF3443 family protein [Burkholderia thailandensis]|uniref:DUF3443 family protein n=1 Tax=Burkholderia thailandensis TaxID=57975 RepID=UPI0023589E5E|nr:DUF3443 family protein [Burkholderia thailandensis]